MLLKTPGFCLAFGLFVFVPMVQSQYAIPDVTFEALKSGAFRAYIPDAPGYQLFAIHANINEEIYPHNAGKIRVEINHATCGFWMVEFTDKLLMGDVIHYWIFVIVNNIGLRKARLSWTVTELLDSYKFEHGTRNCNTSPTTINLGKSGDFILEDNFEEPLIDFSKWTVQQMIPTYSGPNYEFNSYENVDNTRFIKNGKLYLKPVAKQSDEEVNGILDLTQGCTSNISAKCFFRSRSSFILPPVKSAKITSKTSFKYGKVEIKAKLPAGEWIFPIMELEPKENAGENSPKLWIAYSRGNNHLTTDGGIDIGSTLLSAGPVIHPTEPGRSKKLLTRRAENSYSDGFHVYALDWKPGKMTFSFDGQEYGAVLSQHGFADSSLGIGEDWAGPEAPFNKEYFLSLGVGVGGFNDFPDDIMSGANSKPWINGERKGLKKFFDARSTWSSTWHDDNAALQVEYVKIWAV